MNQILAAGGLVWRKGSSDIEFLIVHRPRYRDWTLPKGKLDTGESLMQAAYREVLEETGYRCRIGPKLATTEYRTNNGNHKVVHYWAMEARKGDFVPNSEVDKAEWLAERDAVVRLTYEHDRRLVADLPGGLKRKPDRVWLVRHAHAGSRSDWNGDDELRPLSAKGQSQAKALASFLRWQASGSLLSSPYVRCYDTLKPLGKKLDQSVAHHGSLEEGASAKTAQTLVEEVPSGSVLSTHGDVIPAMLDRALERGMELLSPLECKKASIWMVERDEGVLKTATYLPPPIL